MVSLQLKHTIRLAVIGKAIFKYIRYYLSINMYQIDLVSSWLDHYFYKVFNNNSVQPLKSYNHPAPLQTALLLTLVGISS